MSQQDETRKRAQEPGSGADPRERPTSGELRRFEELLRRRGEEVEADVRRLGHDAAGAPGDPRPEDPEQARVVSDRSQSLRLLERRDRLRAEVRRALDKIPAGTYGLCEQCGSQIDHARLEAVPETRFCLRCEEQRREQIGEEIA